MHGLAFSPDSTKLATASADHSIKICTVATGSKTTHAGHTATVNSVAYSPVGTMLATSSVDTKVKTWCP